MLACRIHAKEDLRIEPVAAPTPGAGEVLLRLGAAGICGSDLHYYFEGRNGSFIVREPLIPGHEASGVVAAVGPGVTRVKVGDNVAISPSHACGRCEYCRDGREHLCTKMKFLGASSLHVRVFREYFAWASGSAIPRASRWVNSRSRDTGRGLHAVNRGGDPGMKSVLTRRDDRVRHGPRHVSRAPGKSPYPTSSTGDRAGEARGRMCARADRGGEALVTAVRCIYEVSRTSTR